MASGLLSITRALGQTTGIALLGAFWAARVIGQAGTAVTGGATAAPPEAQVAGLQDTFAFISVLIALALALSLWGLNQERRLQRELAAQLPLQ